MEKTMFQSTPGPEGPGDASARGTSCRQSSFNPRPAPRGQATASGWTAVTKVMFQSTPGPEGPGDRAEHMGLQVGQVSIHARPRGARQRFSPRATVNASSFNPRPAPRGQATGAQNSAR